MNNFDFIIVEAIKRDHVDYDFYHASCYDPATKIPSTHKTIIWTPYGDWVGVNVVQISSKTGA